MFLGHVVVFDGLLVGVEVAAEVQVRVLDLFVGGVLGDVQDRVGVFGHNYVLFILLV